MEPTSNTKRGHVELSKRASRFAPYVISVLCLIGGAARLQTLWSKNKPPDQDVLLFFLAAAVVLLADSITKFKFGDMEFERTVETLQERVQELAEVSRDQQTPPGQTAGPSAGGRGAAGGAPDLAERARRLEAKIYAPPLSWSDDPVAKEGWPRTAKGSELSASVSPSSNYPDMFRVSVSLEVGSDVPIGEDPHVAILLHHTFRDRVRLLRLTGRSAQLTLLSRGCFTVGALLPDGTPLAVDLAQADLSALSERDRHIFVNT